MKPICHLSIADLDLKRCERGYLLGTLQIGPVFLHVEAIEVQSDSGPDMGGYEAVLADFQYKIAAMESAESDGDHDWQLLTIAGKPYLLLITPFQR